MSRPTANHAAWPLLDVQVDDWTLTQRGDFAVGAQTHLGRTVVIKTVPDPAAHPEAVDALVREARAIATLDHPYAMRVHGLGRLPNGGIGMLARRVEGAAWSELLADPAHPTWATHTGAEGADPVQGRLPDHLEVLLKVCMAIANAHKRGVAHCGLGLDAVVVGELGQVQVVAWSQASVAPEEAQISADVRALGAMLCQIVTGQPATDNDEVVFDVGVDPHLSPICQDAKSGKYATVLGLRRAIVDYLHRRRVVGFREAAGVALHELVQLLEREETGSDVDGREVYGLAAKAEFGLLKVLELFPDDRDVSAQLEEYRELMVDRALRQRDEVAARRLLGQMVNPSERLVSRAAALEQTLRAEDQRRSELLEWKADIDPAVGHRLRTRLTVAASLLSGGLQVVFGVLERTGVYAAEHLTYASMCLLTLVVLAGFWLFGRTGLARNVWGRRHMEVLLAIQALPAALFVGTWLLEVPFRATLTLAMLVMTTLLATVAVAAVPVMRGAAVIGLGLYLLGAWVPGYEYILLGLVTMSAGLWTAAYAPMPRRPSALEKVPA